MLVRFIINKMAIKQNESDTSRQNSKAKMVTVKRDSMNFFKTYFMDGQNRNYDASRKENIRAKLANNTGPIKDKAIIVPNITKDNEDIDANELNFCGKLLKSRRLTGILIPMIFFHVSWWCLAIEHNFFRYFQEKYAMTLTMIGGALIAGMTSEGGGSVAFPVMTIALKISPVVARDFSLMIQSYGMTAAAFTILWMDIKLELHSVVFCSTGALFGMIFGLEVLDEILHPAIKKLGFVSIWFSFAFALFLLNWNRKRPTFDKIQNCGPWKICVLILTGFAGGIFSALSGSGVDICSFSVLCLLFRVSEKVATPTSVVLMAINTCVGFFWRELMVGGVSQEAWEFTAVCVPVVVLCAPLGSMIASHFHRLVLAYFVYITDTVALVSALCLIPMYPNKDPIRIIVVACLLAGGFSFFGLLSWIGGRLCRVVTISSGAVISNKSNGADEQLEIEDMEKGATNS